MDKDSENGSGKLLLNWWYRVRKLEKAHFRSASSCRVFNYSLGIPLVILTAIVASEVFNIFRSLAESQYPWADSNGVISPAANMERSSDTSKLNLFSGANVDGLSKTDANFPIDFDASDRSIFAFRFEGILVLFISLATPVIAAVQTFMRFPERAEAHRVAAGHFGQIKHDIEQLLDGMPEKATEKRSALAKIKDDIVTTIQQSPSAGTISLWRARRLMR